MHYRPNHGGNLAWAASIANTQASFILDFSASINPNGPPDSVLTAINQAIPALRHYPNPDYSELKSSLSRWHQLPPDWFLPGNGSAELLTWASRELSRQDLTYLITPAFSDYWRALNCFEASVYPFPLSLEHLFSKSAPMLTDDILNPPLRCGLLLNNPHNPTGKLFTIESILPLLEKFSLVVIDEAFMDFLEPNLQQSLIPLIKDFQNLVILRSLTKFYSLPGLRLGYAVSHPSRLQKWQKWRDPWSVNVLAAAAGEAAMADVEFQRQTWNWLPSTRAKFFHGLQSLSGIYPIEGAANFLLVKSDFSCSNLQEQLLKKFGILIRDCLSFPDLGDAYFRVAIRNNSDNERLLEAMNSIL